MDLLRCWLQPVGPFPLALIAFQSGSRVLFYVQWPSCSSWGFSNFKVTSVIYKWFTFLINFTKAAPPTRSTKLMRVKQLLQKGLQSLAWNFKICISLLLGLPCAFEPVQDCLKQHLLQNCNSLSLIWLNAGITTESKILSQGTHNYTPSEKRT